MDHMELDFDETPPFEIRKRVPRWVKHPRVYPWTKEDGSPLRPKRIAKDEVINRVQILKVHKEPSHFYDNTTRPGRVNRFEHLSGQVDCLCLVCNQEFTAPYYRLHPNNPARSLWSCGCERRPFGMGFRAKGERPGRRPADLTDHMFGKLEPISWVPYQGWLCLCHGCGNTDGCIVPASCLTRGTVTECPDCNPGQWSSRTHAGGLRAIVAQQMPVAPPAPPVAQSQSSEAIAIPEVEVIVDWEDALRRARRWEAEARKPRGEGKLVDD